MQRLALRDGLEQLLNLLWESLTHIARCCRNKARILLRATAASAGDCAWVRVTAETALPAEMQALGALFLMNNAHYQLKSVQTSSSLNDVSQDWQDECGNKVRRSSDHVPPCSGIGVLMAVCMSVLQVKQYGLQYQQAAWDPILGIMRDDPKLFESKTNWMKEKVRCQSSSGSEDEGSKYLGEKVSALLFVLGIAGFGQRQVAADEPGTGESY